MSVKWRRLVISLFSGSRMKILYKKVGFNFEYSLLIAIFAGLLVAAVIALSSPNIKDGAAWVQAICGICTLIAVLAIAAIQRKHAYLQSMEDFEVYTLKAYQVASQAVSGIAELNSLEKMMYAEDIERELVRNGLAVLYEAVNGFEVSSMSSAAAAIALLRIKQKIKDVETVYSDACRENSDRMAALARLQDLSDNASKELDVLRSEVSLLEGKEELTWISRLKACVRRKK